MASLGTIQVQPSLCVLCRLCDISCPTGAIAVIVEQRTWSIRPEVCTHCGICLRVCPRSALVLGEDPEPALCAHIPEPRPTKRKARLSRKSNPV
ncbi:4Fe-4S binding protein [Proteiniclasticum sp. QWL-01]|uniref:ATP-binding protein n=1 Tax=Proteiniclasticum sp. QWL-01 TaxID=3036945 RepID=UPI00240F7A24|nr:4Fe-4S binding protein [Proteiniclasticum sp. QWL-01]WFF73065.1 4Fe-4S binding protein [Proteiniclasticum sp. QWL-01]